MSTRKPKSIKIILDNNSEDEELAQIQHVKPKAKVKPRKKQKLNLFNPQVEEDEDGVDLDQFKITANKKVRSRTPLFETFLENEIDSTFSINKDELIQTFNSQKRLKTTANSSIDPEDTPSPVISKPSFSHYEPIDVHKEDDFISLNNQKEEILDKDEWREDANELLQLQTTNDEMLDDGRLPLTENEALKRKVLEEMGIRHDLYEAQIDGDEDEDIYDWEKSKINSADLGAGKTSAKKFMLPKLSTIKDDETLEGHIQQIVSKLEELNSQSKEIKEGIEREEAKLVDSDKKYNELIAKVNGLV